MHLLSLHGFTGCGTDFELFASQCKGNWICPDLPGHGVNHSLDCSVDSTNRWIHQQYDKLPKGKKVVIGYSMGARAALNHAVRNPLAWDGIILISGTAGIENEHERTARRESDERLAQSIEAGGVDAFLKFWQDLPIIKSQQSIRPDWLTTMQANRLRNTAEGLSNSLRGFGQGSFPNLWPEIDKLKIPVLCLTGEFDSKYRRINERIIKKTKTATHVVVREAGHTPHLENPDICAPWVDRFLKDIR
jgi:2-succinyl-6-hydroxy-2,4-cyclohexadiene-1-carboxylate synthase